MYPFFPDTANLRRLRNTRVKFPTLIEMRIKKKNL